MSLPKVITNWNVSIQGKSYLGLAESIELPNLKETTQEVHCGGMYGKRQIVTGVEPLSCKMVFVEVLDPVIFSSFGLGDVVGLICKASIGHGKDAEPLTAILHGAFREITTEAFKMGEIPKTTVTMDVRRYSLLRNNIPITAIDLDNNIINLKGAGDILEQTRSLLGV